MASNNNRPKNPSLLNLSELDLIARYFAPLTGEARGAFSLQDDAAYVEIPNDRDLVVTTDSLVEGVHFPFLTSGQAGAYDIGWKTLAVNLSDLAAKGAQPLCYLMNFAAPHMPDETWLEGFCAGLADLQREADCPLTGGDSVSTSGPHIFTITAFGTVPKGQMITRLGGQPGERLYVTGTLGDAALGYDLLQDANLAGKYELSSNEVSYLQSRYLRPSPRLNLAQALHTACSAAMDISDGLAGDLHKLCAASQCGAEIDMTAIPHSAPLDKSLKQLEQSDRQAHERAMNKVLSWGDDYEILCAVKAGREGEFEQAAKRANVKVCPIGHLTAPESGLNIKGRDAERSALPAQGYQHF